MKRARRSGRQGNRFTPKRRFGERFFLPAQPSSDESVIGATWTSVRVKRSRSKTEAGASVRFNGNEALLHDFVAARADSGSVPHPNPSPISNYDVLVMIIVSRCSGSQLRQLRVFSPRSLGGPTGRMKIGSRGPDVE